MHDSVLGSGADFRFHQRVAIDLPTDRRTLDRRQYEPGTARQRHMRPVWPRFQRKAELLQRPSQRAMQRHRRLRHGILRQHRDAAMP